MTTETAQLTETHEQIARETALPVPEVKAFARNRRTTYSAQLAKYILVDRSHLSPDCPQPVHQEHSDGPSKRERL